VWHIHLGGVKHYRIGGGPAVEVTVDLDLCRGHATCTFLAPTVFDLDDDTNKVILLQAHPSQELAAKVDEARRACPVVAISVDMAPTTTA
jgi:ferredoxin